MKRIIVVLGGVALAFAAFMGGVQIAAPSGPYLPLSDDLAAKCAAMGGCGVVPAAVMQYMNKRLEQCEGGRGRT